MQNRICDDLTDRTDRKLIDILPVKSLYDGTLICVTQHKLMCLHDLFLYRSTEFLAVDKIHFFSSFEQGTLDFDITLSRLGQKRKGSGRDKLALFSEQNTKVLQFFGRKLMNRIFGIGTFVF